jgi:hypothetical protein
VLLLAHGVPDLFELLPLLLVGAAVCVALLAAHLLVAVRGSSPRSSKARVGAAVGSALSLTGGLACLAPGLVVLPLAALEGDLGDAGLPVALSLAGADLTLAAGFGLVLLGWGIGGLLDRPGSLGREAWRVAVFGLACGLLLGGLLDLVGVDEAVEGLSGALWVPPRLAVWTSAFGLALLGALGVRARRAGAPEPVPLEPAPLEPLLPAPAAEA